MDGPRIKLGVASTGHVQDLCIPTRAGVLGRGDYCRPQLRVGLKTLKPESQAGARVESDLEGISHGPLAAHPGTLKVEEVK